MMDDLHEYIPLLCRVLGSEYKAWANPRHGIGDVSSCECGDDRMGVNFGRGRALLEL